MKTTKNDSTTCIRCGLLKSTILSTGKLCVGPSTTNISPHDFGDNSKNDSTIAKTKKKILEELIGFNDRGIVEYHEEGPGLGLLVHGEWGGLCQNCGQKFKGKEEIEKIHFGHVGCPSPVGKYIKLDITPEKIEKALDQAYEDFKDAMMIEIGLVKYTLTGYKCGEHYKLRCAIDELEAKLKEYEGVK